MLMALKNRTRSWLADKAARVMNRFTQPLRNEMGGASMVSVVGWSLVGVLVIVLVWGLYSGWLPNFVNSIFARLENLG